MAKRTGPTVYRWKLADMLTTARERAGFTTEEAAKAIDSSPWKIRKIESGKSGVRKPDLESLLRAYGVPESDWDEYTRLQPITRMRGWWTHFGSVGPLHAEFLGVEAAATTIRSWDPLVIPGLLQTEAYIRALAPAWTTSEEETDHLVKMRLERQHSVWDEQPPTAYFVIGEAVLHDWLGDETMMRNQLERLIDPPRSCTVQVLPFGSGPHQGLQGPLMVYDYPAELHTPIAYSESQAGGVFIEDNIEERHRVLQQMLVLALPPRESAARIREIMGK